ncbi:ABC transporter permease [Paenibacillus wulumuqiensis]|uniref:ABC transporter permease n=1 Tax=Paenibacillus wulumuqiensis TaxID=1567107 RepID=UPI00061A06FE|nr:ABC transporter permease [Paenibacillus wulumuqiensis]
MLKLLRLEIKKYHLWRYMKGVIIANLCFLSLLVLIYVLEKNDGNIPFESYDMAFSIIGSVVRATFTVFAAVLITRLFLEEYKTKSISVLFMYPIKRQKIMLAKVLLIIIFTFATILLSNILMGSIFYLMNKVLHFLAEPMTSDIFMRNALSVLISAAASAGIGLIPLYIGMRRKSVPATLVSAVLIVGFTSATSNDFSMFAITAVPVSLAAVGLLSAYLSIRNVETTDIA